MRILVIDGQGGKLGKKLIESIRKACPDAEITAVGTNSTASINMMRSECADHIATGENAVIVGCRKADIIVGPFGIAMADSMLGEITPAMANAVAASLAHRVLIPMNLCDTYVAGVVQGSQTIIEDAMKYIIRITGGRHDGTTDV
ncbi:MAG: DUF3842 family protein [Clostridia bacterium]|nr:DUF3842 family protein [Clostridia bacterium]